MSTRPGIMSSDDRGLRRTVKRDRLKKTESDARAKKRMCVQGVEKGAMGDEETSPGESDEVNPVHSTLHDYSDSTVTPENEAKDSQMALMSGFDALRHLCDVSLMMKQANCSPAPEEISPGESEESYSSSLRNAPTKRNASFIDKLLEMVSNSTSQGVVCWGWEGKSILIRDPMVFQQTVLPKYFRHGNFPSFVRQLNLYGFRKTTQDPANYEYYHNHFIRGSPSEMNLIRRKVASEKGEIVPGKSEMDFDIEDTSEHVHELLKNGTGLAAALEKATFDTSLELLRKNKLREEQLAARLFNLKLLFATFLNALSDVEQYGGMDAIAADFITDCKKEERGDGKEEAQNAARNSPSDTNSGLQKKNGPVHTQDVKVKKEEGEEKGAEVNRNASVCASMHTNCDGSDSNGKKNESAVVEKAAAAPDSKENGAASEQCAGGNRNRTDREESSARAGSAEEERTSAKQGAGGEKAEEAKEEGRKASAERRCEEVKKEGGEKGAGGEEENRGAAREGEGRGGGGGAEGGREGKKEAVLRLRMAVKAIATFAAECGVDWAAACQTEVARGAARDEGKGQKDQGQKGAAPGKDEGSARQGAEVEGRAKRKAGGAGGECPPVRGAAEEGEGKSTPAERRPQRPKTGPAPESAGTAGAQSGPPAGSVPGPTTGSVSSCDPGRGTGTGTGKPAGEVAVGKSQSS